MPCHCRVVWHIVTVDLENIKSKTCIHFYRLYMKRSRAPQIVEPGGWQYIVDMLYLIRLTPLCVGTTGLIRPSGKNSILSMQVSRCQPGPLRPSM